ncbi:ARF GTPase-activating protein GIT2 isoform X9 [Coregonus clupeaformis]|uniref:ARF GTPase-activating protein GIT2 isoform X9 n=1 Tax=Coregonus clupeaformis TaxID=59861 RepID=UPI001E1C592F|nr:ARF GTPase-activating protein GIT2 isoform X9 [Coregonus clupeaformis]
MSKRLRNSEVCADCSVPEPRWASVNRGVLICDECCSVHRSLGRHSSQVRHLTHTPWPPTQLQMVQMLYNNSANSIWEHSLLDPASVMSGKRKANPQDKVHPNKTEFIKAKYQMLAFVHRMPCRDDDSFTAKDLSKQLHSSVRTGNLETCLRLLSLGAQANFFHPEKGNTPLHVAAKAGQVFQAELLTIYGADPGAPDTSAKTPIDYARQTGYHDLADRLVEIQYELTDRLAFYLCGRKPDHKNGQHFIVPQMADRNISLDLSELAKAAKKKLQSLSNHLFEELAMDVYDEVDRRETDAVWLATQNHSTLVTETTVVPFLPVNPEYSSTRNQGRQKLARFNAHEFATLVIDILSDAKRRQLGNSTTSPKENVELILKSVSILHGSEGLDNDQPDYDSVASDEDTDQEPSSGKDRTKSLDSDLSDGPVMVQEFLEVKHALSASEAKIKQLMKVNSNLSDELRLMQKKMGRGAFVTSSSLPSFPSTLSWSRDESAQRASKMEKQSSMSDGDYDNTTNDSELEDSGVGRRGRLRSSGWLGEGSAIPELDHLEAEPDPALPSTEDVIRKTEQITKNIQELLRAAQENKHDRPCERESVRRLRHSLGCFSSLVPWAEKAPSPLQPLNLRSPDPAACFIPCSERIHVAVTEMAALFPKRPRSETVRGPLRLLTSSAFRLQGECRKAAPPEGGPGPDMQLVTQQVIQCAYDIAKAAKQLVTITTKENSN